MLYQHFPWFFEYIWFNVYENPILYVIKLFSFQFDWKPLQRQKQRNFPIQMKPKLLTLSNVVAFEVSVTCFWFLQRQVKNKENNMIYIWDERKKSNDRIRDRIFSKIAIELSQNAKSIEW